MTLEIWISETNHLIVSDGCDIDQIESCIVDKTLAEMDSDARKTSREQPYKYILHTNMAIFYILYGDELKEEHDRIELKCPTCKKTYSIGNEDVIKAQRNKD